MTSQPGKQTIAIHILTNISRSKGNQTMKFGQLIEYNMRTIFLEKVILKMWWRNYFQTLLKNQNGAYLWIISLKFPTVLFLLCAKWRLIKLY